MTSTPIDTHKMNLICTIQQLQEKVGITPDKFENINTYDIEFLEKKRDKLIEKYNDNLNN